MTPTDLPFDANITVHYGEGGTHPDVRVPSPPLPHRSLPRPSHCYSELMGPIHFKMTRLDENDRYLLL